jgi:phage terminase large subunit GpA-like protein
MKEIIKDSPYKNGKKYTQICPKCDCVFTFQFEDIRIYPSCMDVVCPCCRVSIDVEDKIYRENKQ